MAIKKYLSLSALVLAFILIIVGCATPFGGSGDDGARLYALHCAACHGDYGRGGSGVPLALPDFQNSVTDKYLMRTILVGRPGRVMPPFWQLGKGEVRAIVKHVRQLGRTRRGPEFSEEPVKGNPERGEKLFAAYCAECHGAHGEGGEGTGVTFFRPRNQPIIAPALNNSGYLTSASDEMIKHNLLWGREGTPMDSYLEKGWSEADINDVVSFVRSFETRPPVDSILIERLSSAVLIKESPYPMAKTLENLRRAIIAKDYLIVREQFLDSGIAEPQAETSQLRVVYFANFRTINDGLALDSRMGLMLPGRVTLLEQDGIVKLMINDPRQFSAIFNNTALNEMGQTLHAVYLSILEEAVL